MPKKIKNCFYKNLTFEKLMAAHKRARQHKVYKDEIINFEFNLENNITNLLNNIKNKKYRLGKYREFTIYEPKERIIKALPYPDRIVHQWYVEEFIKTVKKFYLGLVVDWVAASTVLLIAPVTEKDDDDIVKLAIDHPDKLLKINLGLQKEIKHEQLSLITDFMQTQLNTTGLKAFLNRMLKVFYSYDATMLEINPIGISKNGEVWALDAKIIFDGNALYRHPDIVKMSDDSETEERELTAAKYGFQYKELESGIGIIVNGDGLALSTINQAQKMGMETACFLNLKGGVDRDKIAASIKLIMTNPKVDGILINILGGFLRCNLIADGIITVANDLGLNIPLVVRFEGTNKNEATEILQKSGLPLSIASDTLEGLTLLKSAIEEDL